MPTWAICLMSAAIFIPLLIMSIILLQGRGAILLSGYNTMPREKRDQYDTPRLCKFMGKILLILNVTIVGFVVGITLNILALIITSGSLFVIVLVFTLIYANTKDRFKKRDKQGFEV